MRYALFFCLFAIPLPCSAALPERPEELPGALVLVGGGNMPDSVRDKFFELAGKEKAKIVVIPTASVDADDAKNADKLLSPWKKLEPLSIVLMHARDRKQADDPDFVKPLTEATAVWIGGGDQARLLKAYKGTLVEKELANLFNRGNVIGGTSAGAAIMSAIAIEGGNVHARTVEGFGWLPGFVVDQHFLQRNRVDRLLGVLDKNPGYVGLGVDEATAVVIRGRTLSVVGDSYAVICLAPSKNKTTSVQVLKSGGAADLFSFRRGALARAGEPFPPAKPADPVVPKGTLVIGGGGGLPASVMKRFVELAGGDDSLIVVVSTANDDPVPADPVESKILRKVGAKNVKTLHTRDRKEANKLEFLKDLKEAKGVWFTGGRQWRFVDSYEGTEAEKLFRAVLERGGVIGGSSAGASIQSDYMPRGHPLGNLVMMAEGYERGFGYLPGVAVDQHFFARKRTQDMTDLMISYPQLLGIGIDEGTAIIVQGSTMEVVGKTKVGVYDRRKPVKSGEKDYDELPVGTKYDLQKRQRLTTPTSDSDIEAILKDDTRRAAWDRLVERGPTALPLLLDALGTGDNAAANWLRTAFDRIVDRELAAGGKRIDADLLIRYAEDPKRPGRARRLSLDTVEPLKPGTRAKLLLGWIDDPEFRFDAIAEVVKKADSMSVIEAKAELSKAFAASRDIDQAKSIAVKLDKLQAPVSVAKHLGCLLDWKLIGPFDGKNMKGFATVYPPEEKIDLAAEYPGKSGSVKWKSFALKEPNPSGGGRFGLINLLVPFGQQYDAVAYAYTSIRVEKAIEAEFRGAGDDNLTVWVNGKRVFAFEEYRNGVRPDRHRFKVMLKEGDNTVLVKICQAPLDTANSDPNWEFLLRVVDGQGKGLVFTANP